MADQSITDVSSRAGGERERAFRDMADRAPVMIWSSRTDKLCDWFNKRWLDFTGRTMAQELGYGWAEGVHPDDVERSVKIYEAGFEARRPFEMEYRLRRHDGEYRWLLDSGAPYEREGVFEGYIGSCVDVTEHHELQAHQQVLLAELEHRVKNNLQLIISFLALQARRVESEEARQVLAEAIRRVRGVGAVQERLHDRGGVGGEVDLAQYLPDLARDIVDSEGHGTVRVAVEAEPVAVSLSQATTLGLMVNELVTNALKHAFADSRGGELRLEVRPISGGRAEIIVADDGPGFPEGTARPSSKGTGLVDALARRAPATLTRETRGGARVCVRFAPHRPTV